MPLYEFICETCDHPFEELVLRMGEINGVECPECGSAQIRKKISLFGASVGGSNQSTSTTTACTTST